MNEGSYAPQATQGSYAAQAAQGSYAAQAAHSLRQAQQRRKDRQKKRLEEIQTLSDDEIVQKIIDVGMKPYNLRFTDYKRTSPKYLMKTISDIQLQQKIVNTLKTLVEETKPEWEDSDDSYTLKDVMMAIHKLCYVAKENKYVHV